MAGKALSKPDVIDFEKYQNLTGDRDKELKVDYKPLNFEQLPSDWRQIPSTAL